MIATALLAHQGGWDEILFVAAPMLLVAGLLVLAKRRATRAEAEAADAADAESPDDASLSR